MWSNFFAAGGFGMYPTSLFGFLLIASSALYVQRPEQKYARLALALGIMTFAAGLLGCSVGVSNTLHYMARLPPAEQLSTLALGCAESLHDLVLGLMLVVLAGLIAAVGVLRAPARVAA